MPRLLPLLILPFLLLACAPARTAQHRGCVPSYQVPDFARLDAELAAARGRWNASGIQDYSYAPQINNFGTMGGDMVGGGGQHSRVSVRGAQVQGGVTDWPAWTMEQHFAEIAKDIATAKALDSCLLPSAEYDATDGHVQRYSSADVTEGLMDAFGGVTLKDFRRN